jgi:hypothetical protein
MQVEQQCWSTQGSWAAHVGARRERAQLVLAFGAPRSIRDAGTWYELRARWPNARIVGCSTAGEIAETQVRDESLVATALSFERSDIQVAHVDVAGIEQSAIAGGELAAQLDPVGLRHVLVLAEGMRVSGSELVRSLTESLPEGVAVTGGLAGDGSRFQHTAVALDERPRGDSVVAIGLYGSSLRVGFGSMGGWEPFGPERLVTRAKGAVLYELDGEPALGLYERYLAHHAAQLPASGLLFPLSIRQGQRDAVVRTILGVNEREQSLTFAGDIPVGASARLMRSNHERLIEGASGAAETSAIALGGRAADVAILISCVGRKLVLQQRVEEEIDAVRHVLGRKPVLTGFYSYGEISPFSPSARCELHNQTMTITTLAED